jgi:hypothetical protein
MKIDGYPRIGSRSEPYETITVIRLSNINRCRQIADFRRGTGVFLELA